MNARPRSWLLTVVTALLLAAGGAAGCARPEEPPARQFPLKGQILAVHADRQELTIRHEDIPDFMPGMTMTFPVVSAELMNGRVAGELITGTLEVQNYTGRMTAITHAGTAPLPENTNQVAMASGVLAEGDAVPDAAFIDQTNRRRSFAEWKGTLTLVTFIYTSCPLPNYCPLMDRNFVAIQRAVLDEPALKGQVKLVSITFDPETDTPERLATHAATLSANPDVWTFLTGDMVTLHRFAGRFGVGVIRPEGITEINHNLRTALVGRDGRILKVYPSNEWAPDAVLTDLRAAVRAQ